MISQPSAQSWLQVCAAFANQLVLLGEPQGTYSLLVILYLVCSFIPPVAHFHNWGMERVDNGIQIFISPHETIWHLSPNELCPFLSAMWKSMSRPGAGLWRQQRRCFQPQNYSDSSVFSFATFLLHYRLNTRPAKVKTFYARKMSSWFTVICFISVPWLISSGIYLIRI